MEVGTRVLSGSPENSAVRQYETRNPTRTHQEQNCQTRPEPAGRVGKNRITRSARLVETFRGRRQNETQGEGKKAKLACCAQPKPPGFYVFVYLNGRGRQFFKPSI